MTTVLARVGRTMLGVVPMGAAAALIVLPLARARATPAHASAAVLVVAKDYSFEMPDTIAAGWTTIRLRNDGAQPHHLILYRLEDGKTAADAMAAVARNTAYPSWMHAAGGPNASAHNAISESVVHLEPGTYVAFCKIPAPDNAPHYAKGMVRTLVVSKTPRVEGAAPTSDIEVSLTEYAFTFSAPLHSGRHAIAVVNRGNQAHELIISQLAPLKTMADYAKWSETQQGLPPLVPVGGTTDIAPGARMLIDITLPPGHYVARCRVLDTSDDRGHDLHGMIREFIVD